MFRFLRFAVVFACLVHPFLIQAQSQRGEMRHGRPVGVWEYYDGKELGLRFNYDSSRIQYIRPDTARYFVQVDSAWQLKRLNRSPRLLGVYSMVIQDIQKQVRYPVEDLRTGTFGTVVITYIVDIQGNLVSPTVVASPSKTMANEVFRAVENVPMHYLPAAYRGKRTPAKVAFVVRFCIAIGLAEDEVQRQLQRQSQQIPRPAGSFDEIIVTALGVTRH